MNNENTVFQSLAVIEENIREKLTVEKLAESLHFSKFHYQRIFREAVGDSVMRYVTGRKLTLAAADLAETDDSILDIALKYGYDSHEGFTRSFKAYIGISPKEYRKYYSYIGTPETKAKKEKRDMLYSKSTDEMIRELNGLIVEAKETAVFIKKNKDVNKGAPPLYSEFWDYIGSNIDAMADTLVKALKPITDISEKPDEITAGFIIIRSIDKVVFQLDILQTGFTLSAGLTVSRADLDHRCDFSKLEDSISALSHKANITFAKMVFFIGQLSEKIFADMKKCAQESIDKAVQKGREIVSTLSKSSKKHYDYIKEGIEEVVKELVFLPLGKTTADLLESLIYKLNIIGFSSDVELFRNPEDKPLFDGIYEFKNLLSQANDFICGLPNDIIASFENTNKDALIKKTKKKIYGNMDFKEDILLFYLKGEFQKLEPYLNDNQKAEFDKIFEKMNIAIRLTKVGKYNDTDNNDYLIAEKEKTEYMKEVYLQLNEIKTELGDYGSAVGFISEEIRKCSICRCVDRGIENIWL